MNIVIVKYNAGNTQSVLYAIERLGINAVITDNPELIQAADKVIFPGVGQAGTAMQYLKERNLDRLLPTLKQPVLGICLGMQLMCTHSEEGDTACLNIFDVAVKKFPAGKEKVPQIGWNQITPVNDSPLFTGIIQGSHIYLIHSYYASICAYTTATCEYILPYSVALAKDNFYGVQFHPEKSAANGSLILQNFLSL